MTLIHKWSHDKHKSYTTVISETIAFEWYHSQNDQGRYWQIWLITFWYSHRYTSKRLLACYLRGAANFWKTCDIKTRLVWMYSSNWEQRNGTTHEQIGELFDTFMFLSSFPTTPDTLPHSNLTGHVSSFGCMRNVTFTRVAQNVVRAAPFNSASSDDSSDIIWVVLFSYLEDGLFRWWSFSQFWRYRKNNNTLVVQSGCWE